MAAVQNEPPLCLELLKAAREREISIRHVHQHTSRGCLFAGFRYLNIGIPARQRERRPWLKVRANPARSKMGLNDLPRAAAQNALRSVTSSRSGNGTSD